MRNIILSLCILTGALLLYVFLIGTIQAPWKGTFVHDELPSCYDSRMYNFLNNFWRPKLDTGERVIIYFDMTWWYWTWWLIQHSLFLLTKQHNVFAVYYVKYYYIIAIDYVPYFNLYDNVDCSDYSQTLRERPISELVQCGLSKFK